MMIIQVPPTMGSGTGGIGDDRGDWKGGVCKFSALPVVQLPGTRATKLEEGGGGVIIYFIYDGRWFCGV